jgi:hypothetical protein
MEESKSDPKPVDPSPSQPQATQEFQKEPEKGEAKPKELSKKAAQRKRKREKEKEEKQKGIDIVQEHLSTLNLGETNEGKTDKQLEFEKELAWCIKQLRLGIVTNNVTPEQSKRNFKKFKKERFLVF